MKYKIIYLLFVLMVTFASCEDVLDVSPQNSLTFRNALETEKDLEGALAGAGNYMRSMANMNMSCQILKGVYMDNDLYGNYTSERTLAPDGGETDPVGWDRYYVIIAQSNVVLHFANQVKMPDARRKIYMGQAYFYKAFVYLELLRRWGDCILVKDDVSLEPQGQSPWTEVCDYAIELAQKAVDCLPEFPYVTDHLGKAPHYKSTPCKGAANALLAHLCAWKAGGKYFAVDQNYDEQALWRRAKAACDSIINSGIYELEDSPELVCTSALVGDSKECIYETVYKDLWHEMSVMDRSQAFCLADWFQSFPVVPNSTPYDALDVSCQIYLSEMEKMFPGDDERRNAYFYKFDIYNCSDSLETTQGLAYPYKWRNPYVETSGHQAGEMINYNQNKVWWRLADIILLRAECAARLGDNATAIEDIDRVRERANAKLYDVSEYGGDVRYAVFKEREKELLFEGYRYYDIIRNGYHKTELEGGFQTASEQDFKDGAFFLTIYVTSMENNPAIRQNKYWVKYM
ncbi:RagB/SusD family nutrient uptake outer membrane protein [Butyricimonas sp. Marseille-P3923]|uniref:RagB/SusD family nutrient uptake outer membrane protein n=1 Tax=Butyricimonas sp. Marseille-P3923 TaxID=1987504 RepID=UPI000C08C950|nr:RagB/SusD family nutrient uptake outer membrane protein [Butyricimonas sp. Marseille-P3923]